MPVNADPAELFSLPLPEKSRINDFFVLPHVSPIERNVFGRVWGAIERMSSEYIGPVFEDIRRQWLWRQSDKRTLSTEFDALGRWRENDPQFKQEAEIDIVGVDGSKLVLSAEYKWRNVPTPAFELEKLRHCTNLIGRADDAQLYAFSKMAFSSACIGEVLQSVSIHLVDFADMVHSA